MKKMSGNGSKEVKNGEKFSFHVEKMDIVLLCNGMSVPRAYLCLYQLVELYGKRRRRRRERGAEDWRWWRRSSSSSST